MAYDFTDDSTDQIAWANPLSLTLQYTVGFWFYNVSDVDAGGFHSIVSFAASGDTAGAMLYNDNAIS